MAFFFYCKEHGRFSIFEAMPKAKDKVQTNEGMNQIRDIHKYACPKCGNICGTCNSCSQVIPNE
jgi:predicted RNA-binding Zn-ribbon protein involved in translation (DUF1610 family)